MGDLNVVLKQEEKKGCRPFDRGEADVFNNLITDMNLQDLGFSGYPFTWCNQRTDNSRVEERLDRSLSNELWMELFPKSSIQHLIDRGSDHGPIILKTNPNWKDGAYPLKYFGPWMEHPDCSRIIKEAWKNNQHGSTSFSFAKNLKNVKHFLYRWNKNTFGVIQNNIANIKKEIDQMAGNSNRCNTNIKRLEISLNKWQNIDENFWKTKRRNNVINMGDRNTTFFHNAARTRYHRNKIDTMKDTQGNWLKDRKSIANCLTSHFQSMATTSNPTLNRDMLELIPTVITATKNASLMEIPLEGEIKSTLFAMEGNKTPGPNGFPPNFFQDSWETIGKDLIGLVQNFFKFGYMLKEMNSTFISLIPKLQFPSSPGDFRPISLYDCIIFCKANINEANKLLQLMAQFSECSGKMVNLAKSGIFFNNNTSPKLKLDITEVMQVSPISLKNKYQGSPLFTNKSKVKAFNSVIDSIKHRIQGWNNKTVNPAGKRVLIKHVTSYLVNYQMSTFKIPKTITNEIYKNQRDFFWGKDKEKSKGIYPKAWVGICKSLEEGGLGFVNLEKFNSAIISKTGWRMMEQPNSIGAQVMKSKYYKKEDIMHMSTFPKPTDSWDNWVNGLNAPPTRPDNFPKGVEMVADLLTENNQWNRSLIYNIFPHNIADKVIHTTIRAIQEDRVKWSLTKDGTYTVKSLYNKLTHRGQSTAQNKNWMTIWNLGVSPSIRIFLWKDDHSILPTGERMGRHLSYINASCKICNCQNESLTHLFINCLLIQNVWRELHFEPYDVFSHHLDFHEWLMM
ncbi:uncharacterized protein LOC113290908 [Papaver somniferum]|uniref:uncharacterized protein LOC113290908 n=1 Tax=Papaver somniferum TaxID=3469 RepID=UPI000E6F64BC|nr:uncharacterized protein LOC113290908 [Papaver somniferum]